MPEPDPKTSSNAETRGMQRSAGLWIATVVTLLTLTGAAYALVGRGETASDDSQSANVSTKGDNTADDSGAKKSGDGKTGKKGPQSDKENVGVENPFPNRFKAPSLDGGSGWLNTSGEITMKDLRGKVVIFDFWNGNAVIDNFSPGRVQ